MKVANIAASSQRRGCHRNSILLVLESETELEDALMRTLAAGPVKTVVHNHNGTATLEFRPPARRNRKGITQ